VTTAVDDDGNQPDWWGDDDLNRVSDTLSTPQMGFELDTSRYAPAGAQMFLFAGIPMFIQHAPSVAAAAAQLNTTTP
jgi:hypothetical protein